jgi:hypothetical protein
MNRFLMNHTMSRPAGREVPAGVYCPICTHTVEATAITMNNRAMVKPGQRCARCLGSLDAGVVIRLPQAA